MTRDLSDEPDAALVRRAVAGERPAFAVLYHRHVRRVHETVRVSSPDATAARALTVAAFSDLLRHLTEVDPERVGEALVHLARRRAAGHTPGSGVPALTVGTVDAIWRELDRRWPTGEPPRREAGDIVPVTVGALVAVLVLGGLASAGRRGADSPDPSRTLAAVALEAGLVLPEVEPDLPRPPSPDPVVVTPAPPPSPAPEPTPTEPTPSPSEPAATEPAPTASPSEPDRAPSAQIVSPRDGEARNSEGSDEGGAYATFRLEGEASDDRDPADLLTFEWTSDREGPVLTGPSGSVRLHVPEDQLTASHRLTLTVTDAAGNRTTDAVTVIVTRV